MREDIGEYNIEQTAFDQWSNSTYHFALRSDFVPRQDSELCVLGIELEQRDLENNSLYALQVCKCVLIIGCANKSIAKATYQRECVAYHHVVLVLSTGLGRTDVNVFPSEHML